MTPAPSNDQLTFEEFNSDGRLMFWEIAILIREDGWSDFQESASAFLVADKSELDEWVPEDNL